MKVVFLYFRKLHEKMHYFSTDEEEFDDEEEELESLESEEDYDDYDYDEDDY